MIKTETKIYKSPNKSNYRSQKFEILYNYSKTIKTTNLSGKILIMI